MTWQDSYLPDAATTPADHYTATATPYAPTSTSSSDDNFYQSGGLVTVAATATSIPDVGEGETGDCIARICEVKRYQGAIIALGIICGLLLIGFAVLLFVLCYRRRQDSAKMEGEFVISPGYQAMERHKHRSSQTESSKGDTDEATDYLAGLKGYPASKRHRRHRRSQPVTRADFERLRTRRTHPAWTKGGQRGRTRYAQFANAGPPMYYQSGNGHAQAIPIMQVPVPTQTMQQQGGVEEIMSEMGSKHRQHQQSSVRRQHSRGSSSNGRRSD